MAKKIDDRRPARKEAEREIRRGNFKTALNLYENLAEDYPDDPAIKRRLNGLKELLQPMELMHPKTAGISIVETSPPKPAYRAEAAAYKGDVNTAISGYEKLLAENPENRLYLERLNELRTLSGQNEHKANPSYKHELRTPEPIADQYGLPFDAISCLEILLCRIQERRKNPVIT